MTVAKSIKSKKPAKPYPEFPLWPNTNGQWSKKIKGRLFNFGIWSDWESALVRYRDEVDGIHLGQGRAVGLETEAESDHDLAKDPLLRDAINGYLTVQKSDRDLGDISPEHFDDLLRTWKNIIPKQINLDVAISDLKPAHFRVLKTRFRTKLDGTEAASATMQGHIRRTKMLFRWLVDEGVIDQPPAYGAKFGKLSQKQKEKAVQISDSKQFTRDEILSLLKHSNDAVNYRLNAMLLLGINAALGPRDIATLTFDQLDLDSGWLIGNRNKTAVRRCSKLWTETVDALRKVIERRFEPEDSDNNDLIFITRLKRPYLNKGAISRIFGKLKVKANIEGPKRGFYVMRHVCRDIANRQRDDTASRWIMGHKRRTIDDEYTKTPPRDRIETVCDSVREWLFGGEE